MKRKDPRLPYQTILITGSKHSGKTLCAKALGKIMNVDAVDLDDIVKKYSGKTPRVLFEESAEIFRMAEKQALSSIIQPAESDLDFFGRQSLRIIAAGGGLIDNADAMALLHDHPEIIIVYLDVSAETAWQRILRTADGGELPPFLNTENPKETHLALHKRRSDAYKKPAGLIIAANNKSPEEIAGEIVKHLNPEI